MNHMGMSLLGREDETAEFEAFLQGDDRVLLYWGVAGQGKSTLVEHLAACCPKDGHVVDLEYMAGRRNPSSDSADAARELLDELAEVLGGWCGTGTPAYRRAADRADADEQALLTRNITLKATMTARGNSSIVESPISLSAGSITEPLANLRALNRSKLVRALCDDLQKADLSGRVLFVDTTERLYYLDEVAYFEAGGGARGADEIGHWFANRFVPHLLRGAKGLKLVLAGREEVPMKSGIRCRRRELRNWSSTDSDAYLASRGQEADGFQQAVYRLCKGHPGWTSMLSDTAAILDWGEIDLFELERTPGAQASRRRRCGDPEVGGQGGHSCGAGEGPAGRAVVREPHRVLVRPVAQGSPTEAVVAHPPTGQRRHPQPPRRSGAAAAHGMAWACGRLLLPHG